MEIIENSTTPPLGNNNPQTVIPNLQTQQPLQPTVTHPPSSPEQVSIKKRPFKKILFYFFGIVFLVIILLVGVVLFSIKVLHKVPHLVAVPSVIPQGFVKTDGIQSGKDENGSFYIFTYKNIDGKAFTYHMLFNAPIGICETPPMETSIIKDYQLFRPKDSDDGCAMTLTDKDGNITRVYKWRLSKEQFFIFANNLSINDQEALMMANTLKVQLIIVGD